MTRPYGVAAAALLRFADAAELLPYESDDERPFACGHFSGHMHRTLVGGLYLVVADGITSQVLPSPSQSWLAFAAFDHLTATPPAASNPDTAKALRQRMQVMELLIRLTMTQAHDWQSHLMQERRTAAFVMSAQEIFRWPSVLRDLVGTTWVEPTTQLALMALRWGHPRFLLEWQHDPIPDDFPLLLAQLLSGVEQNNQQLWEQDSDLRALLQRDLATTNAASVRPVQRHRIVELGLAFQHGRISTSLLFRIVEVLERFGEAQRKRRELAIERGDAVSIEFRFTTLRFEHMSSIAGSALEHLGDLVRNSKNLYIEELKLPRLMREEERCVQRCLADLTTPGDEAATNSSRPTVASRLTRLACQNDSKSFAVFGSMLRYDTALHALDVFYVPDDMNAIAAWLAFGVFHADSASQITSLCLRMPGSQHFDELTPLNAICSPQWIEVFKRVLMRAASAEELAPIDPKTLKSGKRKRGSETANVESPLDEVSLPDDVIVSVEVKTNTKARGQPLLRSPIVAIINDTSSSEDDDDEDTPRVTRAIIRFQVVRKLRGWLAVAVPGAGAAWIPSTVVTSEHMTSSRALSSKPVVGSRVKSLAWVGGSFGDDIATRRHHADALMDLLALIGKPLEVLQLPFNGLLNVHIAQILLCCPNLKELNLAHNEITDIGPLVDAYADGKCKITTLNVSQDGEEHSRVVQQISRILEMGNEDSQKCTAIERLALRVTPFDEERIDFYVSEVIPPMQKAMFKSSKLEFARIHCDDLDQGNLANEITRLRHEEYMANKANGTGNEDLVVSRPMPLRAKLALLSVVRHESTQRSALGGLDGGVVGLIMQFARTTQLRVVSIAADPPMF